MRVRVASKPKVRVKDNHEYGLGLWGKEVYKENQAMSFYVECRIQF